MKLLDMIKTTVGTKGFMKPCSIQSLVSATVDIEPCELSAEVDIRTELRIGTTQRVPESEQRNPEITKSIEYMIQDIIYGDIRRELQMLVMTIHAERIDDNNTIKRLEGILHLTDLKD